MADFFDLFQPERNAIHQLLDAQRHWILKQDLSVTGFNVGNNAGQSAGQTVMHAHTHLIPRRLGDMPDPRGGIRGVIPEKQNYGSWIVLFVLKQKIKPQVQTMTRAFKVRKAVAKTITCKKLDDITELVT